MNNNKLVSQTEIDSKTMSTLEIGEDNKTIITMTDDSKYERVIKDAKFVYYRLSESSDTFISGVQNAKVYDTVFSGTTPINPNDFFLKTEAFREKLDENTDILTMTDGSKYKITVGKDIISIKDYIAFKEPESFIATKKIKVYFDGNGYEFDSTSKSLLNSGIGDCIQNCGLLGNQDLIVKLVSMTDSGGTYLQCLAFKDLTGNTIISTKWCTSFKSEDMFKFDLTTE
jgi:hypothetical protein